MTQARQTPRRHLLSTYQNVAMLQDDNVHNRPVTIPTVADQMDINISAMIQVGRQLAIIGDECNRTCSGKLEDSLFHLAKWLAIAFQTCTGSNFRNAMKSFASFLNRGWRKKIIDGGCWIFQLPFVCQKWVPATFFAILMWWLMTNGSKN